MSKNPLPTRSATKGAVAAEPFVVRPPRGVAFRVVAGLLALVFIVLFGAWQSILAPWMVLPDSGDHGWARTSELHRVADSASGILMLAVGVGAGLLAVRPFRHSAVVLWLAVSLAMISVGSAVSILLQEHADAVGALLSAATMALVLVVPVVVLHPQRRAILRGGLTDQAAGPSRWTASNLALLAVAGVTLSVWAIGWRLSGGMFENPAEDDVVSVVMLGLAITVGGLLCRARLEGWRVLTLILGVMAAYSVVAGASIALS